MAKKPTKPHLSAAEIKRTRVCSGLTQDEAAALVHLSSRARWSEYECGLRHPDDARWELFLLKTAQHPAYQPLQPR